VTIKREYIENQWLRFLKDKGWLVIEAKSIFINIRAYPHRETEISRDVDLSMCPCWVTDEDVAVEGHELVIGVGKPEREQARLELRHILWSGAEDGSDVPLGGT
jgi:hypothetical protein